MCFYIFMKKVYFDYLNNVLAIVQRHCEIHSCLSSLPEGRLYELHTKRDGVRYTRYLRGVQTHISKKNTELINALIKREKFEIMCRESSEVLSTIINDKIPHMISVLSSIPPDEFPVSVSEENYKREELKHKTAHGEMVRSKSELIIANILFELGINYSYEKKLNTSYGLIYPDFTIVHPYTNTIYYLEHLGLMNEKKYADNWDFKLQKYESIGINEKNVLITTTEENGNINSDLIKEKLEMIFTVKRFNPILDYLKFNSTIKKQKISP